MPVKVGEDKTPSIIMSDGETSSAVDREFGCLYEQCGDLSSKRAYPLKKHLDEVDAKNAFVHEHTIFHATVARHCWCRHSDKGRRAVPSCTQIGPATPNFLGNTATARQIALVMPRSTPMKISNSRAARFRGREAKKKEKQESKNAVHSHTEAHTSPPLFFGVLLNIHTCAAV